MSVPKTKRSQSKVEFEMIYFQLADGIDNLVEHEFFAEGVLVEKNRKFIDIRSESLERFTDDLLYYIKIANSIYPKCMEELVERRLAMDKAIGVCYAILTTLQRILQRLRVPGYKYALDLKNIDRMINSLKSWRKSDNRIESAIKKNTPGP